MSRLFKAIGILAAVLVALLLVLGLAVRFFFDPNDYKDEIAQAVQANTGRELAIDGDLTLSFFPWIAVQLGRTSLSNAPGFGDEPFASIESASMSLRLMPLLRKEIELGAVKLKGFDLNLARNEQGVSNWDDLMQAAEAEEETAPVEEGEAFDLNSLTAGGVSLEDAAVSWNDRQSGANYRVHNFNLRTQDLMPGEPFRLSTDFELESEAPAMNLAAELEARVKMDIATSQYALSDIALDFTASGEPVPVESLEAQLKAAKLNVDLEKQTLRLEDLSMATLGVVLEGAFQGEQVVDNLLIKGHLAAQEFDMRELFKRLESPLETADADALTKVNLTTNLTYGAAGTSFKDLRMRLDDTQLTGELSLDPESALAFDLKIDEIDLDRYLPPPGPEDAEEAESAAPLDAVEVPVETIRALNAKGRLRIGKMRLSGMDMESVKLGISAGNGRVRLHPLESSLYGGSYKGDIVLTTRGKRPLLTLDENVEGLRVGDLSRALYDEAMISGAMQGHFVLKARGDNLGEMRQTLGGEISFNLKDGAIEGFNLWAEIRKGLALARQEPVPEEAKAAPPRTEFSSVSGSATVKDGVVTNNDLLARLPSLNMTGGGTIDLVKDEVDYRVKAVVLDTPELQAQEDVAGLAGTSVPVKITGAVFDPSIRPDVARLAKDQAKEKAKEKLAEKLGLGAVDEDPTTKTLAADAEPKDPEEQLKEDAKKKLLDKLFD